MFFLDFCNLPVPCSLIARTCSSSWQAIFKILSTIVWLSKIYAAFSFNSLILHAVMMLIIFWLLLFIRFVFYFVHFILFLMTFAYFFLSPLKLHTSSLHDSWCNWISLLNFLNLLLLTHRSFYVMHFAQILILFFLSIAFFHIFIIFLLFST